MLVGRPSETAQRVAERRAAHQMFDEPRVFEDPWARTIIGAQAEAALLGNAHKETASIYSTSLRFFMALRSRLAEDALARAVARGVEQYVVLGAGLDTFAYRNPYPALTVFEVDFPATQAWKRARLAEVSLGMGAAPPNLRFVPVDFEHQTLRHALSEAGFHADQPACFSWLGVVPYLTRAAAMDTLAYIGSLPAGSGVVFDYTVPSHTLPQAERTLVEALARKVARVGEPFQCSILPGDLEAELRARGFQHITLLDRPALNAHYLQGRTDGFQFRGGMGQLASAWT